MQAHTYTLMLNTHEHTHANPYAYVCTQYTHLKHT